METNVERKTISIHGVFMKLFIEEKISEAVNTYLGAELRKIIENDLKL